jgi:uncharacterized protein (UPF0332 family)
MTEIEDLIGRAYTYLSSAQLLLDNKDFESSVSRSYYAMFFAAEAAMLTKGKMTSTHKGIISEFGLQFIKPGILPKKFGKDFSKAFEKRQVGDYESAKVITEDEAEEVLEEGTGFIEEIVKYLKKTGHLK